LLLRTGQQLSAASPASTIRPPQSTTLELTMGMSLVYRRLSDQERARLENDPPYASSLFPADTPPPMPPEVLARMKEKRRNMGVLKRLLVWFMMRKMIAKMNDPDLLSLDKSWHTVHFLLTGDKSMTPRHLPDQPLHNVVMGGTPTPIDGPYGPVRILDKPDVKAIAVALASVEPASLKNRYSIAQLNAADTYATPKPGGWDQRELEMVLACIPRLKEFFAAAAASSECVGLAVV